MAHIVISGGGMAGASLALLLALRTTHTVTLVEQAVLASDTLPDTPSYDARSTALALGSAEILADLGVWRLLGRHVAPIRNIQVSQQGHFGAARLDAREEGVAALGFVAENRHLGHALLQALKATRVAVRSPMRIDGAARTADGWLLRLADGGELQADLLVVADGVQSATRAALGIGVHEHDYAASAIVCNVTPREPHRDLACERFTDDGALALLPLPDNRCAVVWSLPTARVQPLLALDERDFLAALSAASGNRFDGFGKCGARSAYPLVKTLAASQAVPGAVLLGNAAHLLHPVAGQGFNLTLRDAVVLADTLAVAERAGQSPGDLALLQRYVEARARDQHLTTGLSHGLPQLFANDNPVLAAGRNLGLLAFDILTPLKREFARQSMGIGVFTGGTSRAG